MEDLDDTGERSSFIVGLIENRAKEVSFSLYLSLHTFHLLELLSNTLILVLLIVLCMAKFWILLSEIEEEKIVINCWCWKSYKRIVFCMIVFKIAWKHNFWMFKVPVYSMIIWMRLHWIYLEVNFTFRMLNKTSWLNFYNNPKNRLEWLLLTCDQLPCTFLNTLRQVAPIKIQRPCCNSMIQWLSLFLQINWHQMVWLVSLNLLTGFVRQPERYFHFLHVCTCQKLSVFWYRKILLVMMM